MHWIRTKVAVTDGQEIEGGGANLEFNPLVGNVVRIALNLH